MFMKIFWKFYSVLFLVITSSSALQLLDKNSFLGVYYNTTIVFSNWYIIPYILNILCILITCIVCLFIFGYAFDIKSIPRTPRWLFYVRILSECTGHAYEFKMIQSRFYQSKVWGFVGIATLILLILPSYIAQWRMTFKNQ